MRVVRGRIAWRKMIPWKRHTSRRLDTRVVHDEYTCGSHLALYSEHFTYPEKRRRRGTFVPTKRVFNREETTILRHVYRTFGAVFPFFFSLFFCTLHRFVRKPAPTAARIITRTWLLLRSPAVWWITRFFVLIVCGLTIKT